jgi:uncharacterized DUF497 family protein
VAVRLSWHASQRMARRRISQEEVEQVLANPETSYPSADYPEERLVILGSTDTGRRLKVVVPVDDNEMVITVADRDSEA